MKKLILICFLTIICFLGLNGCKKVKASSITLAGDPLPASSLIEDFKIEDLKIKVTYSDDTSEIISVTTDMISSSDLEKLTFAGYHTIKITYEECETEFSIALYYAPPSTTDPETLNYDVVFYTATIITPQGLKTTFYITKKSVISGFQFRLATNNITDVVVSSDQSGEFVSYVGSGYIDIAYVQSTNKSTSQTIPAFTVEYKAKIMYGVFTITGTPLAYKIVAAEVVEAGTIHFELSN